MAEKFDPTLGTHKAKPTKVTLVDETDPLSALMPKPEPGPAIDWMAEPGQELPPGIFEVWRSQDERFLVRALIAEWGVEKFRNSELHVQAAEQIRAERRLASSRLEGLRALQSEPALQLLAEPGEPERPDYKIPSDPVFQPMAVQKPKRKPKSKGRSETCVHRIAPGNYCKFGCDE